MPTALAAALLVVLIAGTALTSTTSDAQPKDNVVIGVLGGGTRSTFGVYVDAFRQALRERGYVEARSVRFEERWAEGRPERLPELAAQLVRLKVDVILATGGTPSILAAKHATREIPIVFTTAGDPVGLGLVDSLARPGGNVTGLSMMDQELSPKRLELLRQALPNVTRVALLTNLENPSLVGPTKKMEEGASSLKIDLRVFAASMKYRLPTMVSAASPENEFFLAFGFDRLENWRRAAVYVDKILKGARPTDLPVEQPMKFRLVVNLKTAKALGITIPPAVLLQADEVIP